MNRILIPTDFSREAENALQTAIPIAKAFSSRLIILHILEISGDISAKNEQPDPSSASLQLHEALVSVKENLSRSLKLHDLDNQGISYDEIIKIGNPSKQIEAFIVEEEIDLVIMGTKSAWGLNDILLGTTTDKLLRRVNIPVLSVNKVIPSASFKKIVFPTTTLVKESNLISVIKLFQRLFDSKIHLVRINTPLHFLSDKDSLKLLNNYADGLGLKNYECYVYSHTVEEDGIRDFADLKDGGLIAVSTSAHTGLRKLFEGSVTKELVSHSTRPVLTVKADDR